MLELVCPVVVLLQAALQVDAGGGGGGGGGRGRSACHVTCTTRYRTVHTVGLDIFAVTKLFVVGVHARKLNLRIPFHTIHMSNDSLNPQKLIRKIFM